MIKKIRSDQLRIGVYIHDVNSTKFQEHIFISKALIQTEKAIQIICAWGIKEVYIDTEKGLDVKSNKSALEIRQETDKGLHKIAMESQPIVPSRPLKEELIIARGIKDEATTVMQRATKLMLEGKGIDLGSAYQLIDKMESSVARNRDALYLLTRIRKKDQYTLMHSISVCSLVLAFCNYCGFSYETTINMAMGALFHDIGKTQIPLNILNKPGKLDPQEFDVIKKHTNYSAEALANTKDLPYEAFDIAFHHHERIDGSGYPDGLQGDVIEFGAKVASICDVFDAITSARCYKEGTDKVKGLRNIYEMSDSHFERNLAYKFISFIGVYPIGTFVRLENDLLGVVSGSTTNMIQPVVRIFYDDKKKTAIQVREIDLSKVGINIVSYESPVNWGRAKKELLKNLGNVLNPLL